MNRCNPKFQANIKNINTNANLLDANANLFFFPVITKKEHIVVTTKSVAIYIVGPLAYPSLLEPVSDTGSTNSQAVQ